MNIAGVVVLVLLLACVIVPKLHASSDHFGWKYDAVPDTKAVITNVHSITEKIGKNDKRYKTTVEFSDGFYFYSYDTDRKDHFMSYSIGLSASTRQRIIENAQKEHEQELTKRKIRKDLSPNINFCLGIGQFLAFLALIVWFLGMAY